MTARMIIMPDAITPPPSQPRSYWLTDILLIAASFTLILVLFSYLRPLARPDSLALLETAREMLLNHNWITPTLNGVIQLDSPPLFYWLTALSFKLFGITPFAARFWPGVFGILGVVMLYCFGRSYTGRRMGWLCAATLGSGLLFLTSADAASPYVIGTVLLAGSFCCIFATSFAETRLAQNSLLISFWVLCGINCLLLGIAGIILPLIVTLFYCRSMQLHVLFKSLFSIRGIVLFIIIVTPWYYFAQKHNSHFFSYYFVNTHFFNYFDHFRNPLQTLMIIVFGSFAALLPWSLLLNLSYLTAKPNSWDSRFDKPLGVFIFIWVSCTLVYLIGISSQNLLWISLLTPALALAFSKTINLCWDSINPSALKQDRDLLIITLLILTSIFVLLSGETIQFNSDLNPTPHTIVLFWGLYVLFLLGGIACYIALQRPHLKQAAYVFTITGIVWTLALVSALPIIRQDSIQSIVQYIDTHQNSTDVIAAYQHYYPELGMQLHTTTVMLDWENAPKYGALYQNASGWAVSSPFFWQTMKKTNRGVFLIVPAKALPDLQSTIKEEHLKIAVQTPQAVLLTR
jgi:4-amino-4-deoxy-L-arabinose transferase-like glycosyltransferase